MQNCLQKDKSKSNFRNKGNFLLVLVAAILGIALCFNKYSLEYSGDDTYKKYQPTLFEILPEKSAGFDVPEDESEAKMNNLARENSKSEKKDHGNVEKWRNGEKTVRVLKNDGSVSQMQLEEYVKGCVFGEMPIRFEVQALMAQCVAVRTFTVRQMSGNSKHKNADVCTNPACCQNYVEIEKSKVSDSDRKKLEDAVNATRGIIVTYENEPIEAVYHASSGEYTLDSEDVWGAKVEYLRSVPSPEGEAELTSVLYGHRVGMSQQGANILAGQGLDFCDILRYYYTGTELDFLV